MPPKTEIKEKKTILKKPRHVYDHGIPKGVLSSAYKKAMQDLDYAVIAQNPALMKGMNKHSNVNDDLNEAGRFFRRLHYVTVLNNLGISPGSPDLDLMIRRCSSFAEAVEEYRRRPDHYSLQDEVHLAEVYDAVQRDIECTPVADAYMEQMLNHFRVPVLSVKTKDALNARQKEEPRSKWVRTEQEQQEFQEKKKIIRKTIAADHAKQLTSGITGKERWDAILSRKPGMSDEQKAEIGKLYENKNTSDLKLALLYVKELKKISTDELKDYDLQEYHGINHDLHVYNGKLAFDANKMLSDLKLPDDLEEAKAVIKDYTASLAANSRRMMQEDQLMLNPVSEYIRFENAGKIDDIMEIGNLLDHNRDYLYWVNGASGLSTGAAFDKEKAASHEAYRTEEKRKSFENALDQIAAAIEKRILAVEEKNAPKDEPQPERKTVPVQKIPENSLREKGIHAGSQTDAYLRHAEDLLTADPVVREKYDAFRTAMKELTAYTDLLSTPDKENKLIIVDADVLQRLANLYQNALKTGEDLLVTSAARGPKKPDGFTHAVQTIMNLLQKDQKVFDGYDPSRKLAFPQMVNASHSEYIDAEKMNAQIKSGQMSQRMVMSVRIQEEDGRIRYAKGLFTAAEYNDPEDFVMNVLRKYKLTDTKAAKTKSQAERDVAEIVIPLKVLADNEKDKLVKIIYNLECIKDRAGHPLLQYKFENGPATYELRGFLERLNKLSREKRQNFEAFRRELSDAVDKGDTLESAGIPKKSRLDQRSSAMSAVAKLLGRESLIVKSRPMMMKQKGKLIKGTFMEFSELEDSGQNLRLFGTMGPGAIGTAGFIKDAADLQILDFLCGNVDRHHGNMFYRVENDKITGLQGIDNDLSFGLIHDSVLNGNSFTNNFIGLKYMKVITKQMAETIQGLTPEMLKAVLSPYGLSKKETDAACHRLDLLKNAIDLKYASMNPADFQNAMRAECEHQGSEFKPYHLYVLNDTQIDVLKTSAPAVLKKETVREIIPEADNHFTVALEMIEDCGKKLLHEQLEEMKNMKKIEEPEVIQPEVIQPEVKQQEEIPVVSMAMRDPVSFDAGILSGHLQDHIADLEAKNRGFFISSQEYRNVLDYAKIMEQQMGQMAGIKPTEKQKRSIVTMLENMTFICQVYLDRKSNDGSMNGSTTAADRYDAVHSLQDTIQSCISRMGITTEKEFCRLSAIQRARGFHYSENSRQIADDIRYMKDSQKQLELENYQISTLFSHVSEQSYFQTYYEYRDALKHTGDRMHYSSGNLEADPAEEQARVLIEQTQKAMENFSPNHEGMDKLCRNMAAMKKELIGEDGKSGILENVRTMQMTPKNLELYLDLQGLVHLADRAAEQLASPLTAFREKIAERLTRMDLQNQPQKLVHKEGYRDTYRDYLEGQTMLVLTAGKSFDQLKKYAEEPEAELQKQWQKAAQKAGRIRQLQAPQNAQREALQIIQ